MSRLTFIFGLLLFCSCAQKQPTHTATYDYGKFVSVAAISTDAEVVKHVQTVLDRAGIQAVIEGSVVYGVFGRTGAESACY